MKVKNKLYLLIALAFLAGFAACSNEELNTSAKGNGNVLMLNYRTDGGIEGQTYALPATSDECRIDEVYTLFFRSSSHPTKPNQYAGYARTEVSSTTSSGTVRITMPEGEDANAEWQLLFLANFDRYAVLEGEANVEDLLKNKVASLTYSEAKSYLSVANEDDSGFSSPLPMSVSMTKPDLGNVADITFRRRVARIDVSNSAPASNFVLETVMVANARTGSYLFDEGGFLMSDFIHYTGQNVDASAGVVQAKLYVFPNFVKIASIRDNMTTCLIIGGKYNGSNMTTYYRVNVSASTSQNLKANGVYTINISAVSGAGETDPGKAYNGSDLKMKYTLNEWDDTFLETYVFDANGNGLGVSRRNVVFSEEGDQKVELEVFTIRSSTHPLSGDWSVGPVSGLDGSSFFATRGTTESTRKYVQVGVLSGNTGATNRQGAFVVTWGTISVSVNLTQLSPASVSKGIRVYPSDLWFPLAGSSKEIRVSLSGDYTGISRSDLSASVFYNGTDSGWLSLSAGTTSDDPNAGIFYYTLTASSLSAGVRSADLKFILTQGSLMATTQVKVDQSAYESGSGIIRQASLYLLQQSGSGGTYTNRGTLTPQYTLFKGLPTGRNVANNLFFPQFSYDYLKYQLIICSSLDWRIVAPGDAGSKLSFTLMSGLGDPNTMATVVITAKSDAETAWNAPFYVEYENGDRTTYTAFQEGVFAQLPADYTPSDPAIYYYGMMKMNNKFWLDRNLGATTGQSNTTGYYTNQSGTGVVSTTSAKGVYLTRAQADIACPPGFRLPQSVTGSGEWDWVYNKMIWAGETGVKFSGVTRKYVWYVDLSTNLTTYWLLPICGTSLVTTTPSGYYWFAGLGYFYINSSDGTKSWNTSEPSTSVGLSVRCIRN